MSLISVLKKNINTTLFTTPSHGGNLSVLHKFYNWYRADISEIDVLSPQKELEISEKKAAQIYGTKYTKYLTNGSTSGIIAAALTCAYGKKILIWNKAHISHKNAVMLANCEVIEYEQIYNSDWGVYIPLSPEQTENLIITHKPDAIIITNPSYEGFSSDIVKICEICRQYGVCSIIDEAHGALYPFSEDLPQSAVKYADYTIQSLHKTAGGINPTALLHSNALNPSDALKKISTTSPSYPMLATIEATINYLNSSKGERTLKKLINTIKSIRKNNNHIAFGGDDITKILIKKDGLTGFELSEILYNKYRIEDERTNKISTMLLTGIGTSAKQLERLDKVFQSLLH